MTHIGMFTPASPGHMNPMSCLGRELLARGHRVTYFQLRDCEQDVLRNGLEYAPIAEKDFPRGTLPAIYAELGACEGTGNYPRWGSMDSSPTRRRTSASSPRASIFRAARCRRTSPIPDPSTMSACARPVHFHGTA